MPLRRFADAGLSRAEQVALLVEDEILEARLPVGAHLGRRAEFMKRFGISPLVMNETLRILRNRGLVGVRPGTGGGIFVASQPPQVRLGAMDLWFNDAQVNPLDLFEARVHLETTLMPLAYDRAEDDDIDAMREAVEAMSTAADARDYLDGMLALHRALVTASKVAVLDDMHQAIVALLRGSLARASFVEGSEHMQQHSLAVHTALVEAIADRDRVVFNDTMAEHNEDLVRADDPHRSPTVTATRPAWPATDTRRAT